MTSDVHLEVIPREYSYEWLSDYIKFQRKDDPHWFTRASKHLLVDLCLEPDYIKKYLSHSVDCRVACIGALLDLPEEVTMSSDGKQAWKTVRDFYTEANLPDELKLVENLFIDRYNPFYGDHRKPKRVAMHALMGGLVVLGGGVTMMALPIVDSLKFLYGKYYHRYFERKIA